VKEERGHGAARPGQTLGNLEWRAGTTRAVHLSAARGSARRQIINTSTASFADPSGHGTIVASIATGRDVTGPDDSTGIAPGASLYDVRVLDSRGVGDVATTLAGIDWVIYHAREYNIRVLNVSLATDSTHSYLTDPLCRAVRSRGRGNHRGRRRGQLRHGFQRWQELRHDPRPAMNRRPLRWAAPAPRPLPAVPG
jgi:hypothetical protein